MPLRYRLLLILTVLVSTVAASAQDGDGKATTPTAKLVDEYGFLNSEERSLRFDLFFQELSKDPTATGYVYLFCGKKCSYDEIVAHMRGIEIKIALRQFDRSRLVIQNSGFRELFTTQLWLVPAGACLPAAETGVHLKNIEFTKPGKYLWVPYDCCEIDFAQVWKSIKTKP
jgi:hypothetical protein